MPVSKPGSGGASQGINAAIPQVNSAKAKSEPWQGRRVSATDGSKHLPERPAWLGKKPGLLSRVVQKHDSTDKKLLRWALSPVVLLVKQRAESKARAAYDNFKVSQNDSFKSIGLNEMAVLKKSLASIERQLQTLGKVDLNVDQSAQSLEAMRDEVLMVYVERLLEKPERSIDQLSEVQSLLEMISSDQAQNDSINPDMLKGKCLTCIALNTDHKAAVKALLQASIHKYIATAPSQMLFFTASDDFRTEWLGLMKETAQKHHLQDIVKRLEEL